MLRIKYIEDFKNDEPFIVILGDTESFELAARFFEDKDGAVLDDQAITEYVNLAGLSDSSLHLTAEECNDIAEHFRNLAASDKPCHAYFDIEAQPDAEVLISYQEYDGLF